MSLPGLKIHVSKAGYIITRNYERRDYTPVGPIDTVILNPGVTVVFLVQKACVELTARRPIILTEADHLFPWSRLENVRIVSQIRPRPATSFPVHSLLIILTFNAIASSAKQITRNCIFKHVNK